ncbi:MAG: hypothetical protein QF441_10735 [Bacteriovoracaceae bacterium]|jgi:hypothetical protein|nr:hypothetical protein [Halobacteriovoraceae bacterium]MAX68069.1 hypothetical protein [Halobacteriovoraceae bacterium]MDP7321076.1 hypothetical protein [Bacteriovoracaceae bacterium]|tara:strand:+ start:115 stop:357 length:243 start_codon:yes stop_codon:yes gene_type:complete
MKNKNQNPLYVVKKDHVEAADNLIDLLIKKFNLGPLLEILQSIIVMLIENVKNYAAFLVLKEFIEFMLNKLELFRKYSIV